MQSNGNYIIVKLLQGATNGDFSAKKVLSKILV